MPSTQRPDRRTGRWSTAGLDMAVVLPAVALTVALAVLLVLAVRGVSGGDSLRGDAPAPAGAGAGSSAGPPDRVHPGTAGNAGALVGSWTRTGTVMTRLTFNADGTYDVADTSGTVGHSTYSVVGDRLNAGRATYTWAVTGTQLQLRLPDGRVLTYSRAP